VATVIVDFLSISGEAAKRANVAMSNMDLSTWENGLSRNGVNIPRTPTKSTAPTSLPLKRLRRATVVAATDTVMQSAIL